MLTVWDWMQELIVLRSKAFSQDVFRVTFSPDNEGQLTTSGTGHIRFVQGGGSHACNKIGNMGIYHPQEINYAIGGKSLRFWGANLLLRWDGYLSFSYKKNCKKKITFLTDILTTFLGFFSSLGVYCLSVWPHWLLKIARKGNRTHGVTSGLICHFSFYCTHQTYGRGLPKQDKRRPMRHLAQEDFNFNLCYIF